MKISNFRNSSVEKTITKKNTQTLHSQTKHKGKDLLKKPQINTNVYTALEWFVAQQ